MKTKVYIILLNFNNWKDTVECLESIIKNRYDNYQVVIVDNKSSDDSIDELIKSFKKMKLPFVRYSKSEAENPGLVFSSESEKRPDKKRYPVVLIDNGENKGFSAGNNVGMSYGLLKNDAGYFWILNNDTVIDADSLVEMVRLAEENEMNGIIGSKLIFYYRRDTVQTLGNENVTWKGIGNGLYDGIKDSSELSGVIETKSVIGASMLVKREVVDKIGLMDEKFFMYHEESDWCTRASHNGYRLLINCRSVIFHKEGGSTGRKRTVKSFMGKEASRTTISDFLMWGYYSFRNEIYFVRKNFHAKYFLYIVFILPQKIIKKNLSVFLFNDDYKIHRLYLLNRGLFDGLTGRMGKTIDPLSWKQKFKQ